jgi:hypothetical protein
LETTAILTGRVAAGPTAPIDDGRLEGRVESNFLVDRRADGRATSLTVTGELDLLSSPVLERAQAHQRMHDAGRRLVLVRARAHVQRLFDLTGVSESLTIVDSPDAALATREGDLASKPEASRDRRAR